MALASAGRLGLMLLAIAAMAGQLVATAAPPAETAPAGAEPAATEPAQNPPAIPITATTTTAAPASDPLAPFRSPLLREGSSLVEVKARMVRDDSINGWRLILQDATPEQPAHELILLPCTILSEMKRFAEAAPNQILIFQVTGEVYLYRGRNYIMPTHAPVLTQEEATSPTPLNSPAAPAQSPASASPVSPSAVAAKPGAKTPAASKPNADSHSAGGDSAQDIANRLAEATGPLARNATPPPSTKPAAAGPAPATRSGSGGTGASGGTGERGGVDKIMRENTTVFARRGRLKRDIAGGWLFVFDADASGLADPPMKLLPCLLLERIEDYARKTGNNAPAMLSGQVYLSDSRNYLLPTVFRIPQERRNITP